MSTTFSSFKVAALAAAVALAMGSTAVMAAPPAATQLPGQGKLITTGTASTTYTTGSTMDIALTGNTVIDWNQGTDFNKGGVAGFNIGSGATVNFTGSNSVLNLDSTGNASQIFGTLTGVGNVFVANSNGIIVGAGASISSSGATVGLIGNALSPTVAADFLGGFASIGYNGTGGDVTVLPGATISGFNKVFISGGGTVNVDLGGVTGTEIHLSAGLPQAGGAFAGTNANAMLAVSDAAGNTDTPTSFASAGDASSSGALELGSTAAVAGTFTNTGNLTLDAGFAIDGGLVNNKTVTQSADVSMGSLTNNGAYDGGANYRVDATAGGISNNGGMTNMGVMYAQDGDFTNNGQIDTNGRLEADYGNFTNNGKITGAQSVDVYYGGNFLNTGTIAFINYGYVYALNGSIVNSGTLSGINNGVFTASDTASDGFTKGADYSVTNTGTIIATGDLYLNANSSDWGDHNGAKNDSTGSVSNTGVLRVGQDTGLYLGAYNDVTLAGTVQAFNGTKYAALSATNPLYELQIYAGDYGWPSYALNTDGVATLATNITTEWGAKIAGNQVKLMANLSSVDATGAPSDTINIIAGDKSATDYAVRVAKDATVLADTIEIDGDTAGNNPNVILQGTISGNEIRFGYNSTGTEISDLFSGPTGSIVATGDSPHVHIYFTGMVKTAPYLNTPSNFRYNYLSITAPDDVLYLDLNPVAYATNGTSNGKSAVNILVNGDVEVDSGIAPAVSAGGSAVTGVTNWENTHLVLQSTGDIETSGDFYWPGYVYLGNIASDANGALPATLGLGQIALNGNFNNVLPGNVDIGGGVHFMTQFPLQMNDYSVTTNANAWVNFGTELMTSAYASGTLGAGQFFGGVKGSGSVVNYNELDPSMFHTHVPVATK